MHAVTVAQNHPVIGGRAKPGTNQRRCEKSEEARLIHAGVNRKSIRAFRCWPLRSLQRANYRHQASQMHHPAAVRRVKIVAGIIEGTAMVWTAMQVYDKDPAKPLGTQLVAQVHEHGS